jgi:hypothetical protein
LKYKKYVYLSIAAIAIIITVLYYYFNYVKPVRFINHYLCVRYDGTNEQYDGDVSSADPEVVNLLENVNC